MEDYCNKHEKKKEKLDLQFNGNDIYRCVECYREYEAKEEERELQEESERKQRQINRRIDNAMLSPRFKDKTFDNYNTELDSQKKAVETAKWFLDNMDNSTGLILIGNPGTGKNHLVTALINEAIKNHNKTALFTETLKIIRAIKESWRKDGEAESQVIKSFVIPDILAIDEIGVQFGSETERMYLTEIINDRYNNKRPTILMGNVKVSDLGEIIGERPLDRFREGGKVIKLDGESYRGKP